MTVLYDKNPNPTGRWGWWGDPNITDEMIVDYEIRNQRLPEQFGVTLPLPNPRPNQADPREIFNPFGFPGGLAGRYMGMGMDSGSIWPGSLGGLIGAGIKFFGKRK